MTSEKKEKKKRGRRPKHSIVDITSTTSIDSRFTESDKNIIVQLPIKLPKFQTSFKDEELTTYNPNIDTPEPNETILINDNTTNDTVLPCPYDPKDEYTSISFNNKSKDFDNEISKSNDDNKNIKIHPVLVQFIDANQRRCWPSFTNISCWWCCHNFDTPPCSIPEKHVNGVFHVYGCFCSYNCAIAYIFKESEPDKWKKYYLLKKLFNTCCPDVDISQLREAPSRQSLEMFGGPLTIDDFRQSFHTHNKIYQLVTPPMTSIIPILEEHEISPVNNLYTTDVDNSLNVVQIDKEKIENANKNLVLKRSKPLSQSKNSLEITMGLKVV